MTRGLVVGKFYPPHRGHAFLIDAARAQVDELTILVCHHIDQVIPGERRAEWLREMAPGATVRVVPDVVPADDSAGWADYTRRNLGWVPDVVFTSEDYGEAYARFLGARHVLVDRLRIAVPVSATAIRSEPLRYWEYLPLCVRAHFARRVVVIGAESSGTTTLAQALALHYRTIWVPEVGRLYSAAKYAAGGKTEWLTQEFVFIAEQQNRWEDQLARLADRLLICDTDALATGIWHERYVGTRSPAVEALAGGRRRDLYLLTDVDIPFVPDGVRDGEHIRDSMHARFTEALATCPTASVVLSGSHANRMADAVAACDQVLAGATID